MSGNKNIKIKDVVKGYQVNKSFVKVLDNINLEIKQGEFISLIGHSGCGKSTLLRIIAGLDSMQQGEIWLGDKPIDKPDTDRGMIFQDHRLLPWLNVYDNLAFGYYEKDKNIKDKNIREHIALVGLEGFENAYPHQLSGGMSQRASIARALIHNPSVLLLDEPFGALDALIRMQMQQEMMRIWQKEKTTMIMVTHDIDEAIYLSDRIVILSEKPAKIKTIINVELGRPRDRTDFEFAKIRNKVYKEFFGETNKYIDYVI